MGKRQHQVTYIRVVFAGRSVLSNSPIFYVICYILSSGGFTTSYFKTIGNGVPRVSMTWTDCKEGSEVKRDSTTDVVEGGFVIPEGLSMSLTIRLVTDSKIPTESKMKQEIITISSSSRYST